MDQLIAKIRQHSNLQCFVSFRSRELTFCISPALIALASVDSVLKTMDSELITSLGGLKNILETSPQPQFISDDIWQKVAQVQAKLQANGAATADNRKLARKIIRAIELKLEQNPDMVQFLQQARVNDLEEIEPEGVWDDLEVNQPVQAAATTEQTIGPVKRTFN